MFDHGVRLSRRTMLKGSAALAAAGAATGALSSCTPAPRGQTVSTNQVGEAPVDVSGARVLADKQLGHLRHIRNLADRPGGDWTHMGADDPLQFGFSSYRYQLAHMAYALATAAYHYLPAAAAVIKQPYEKIFEKIIRRDVWTYWKDTSPGGVRFDPGITQLRAPWADPVARENIMYSGHVLAMMGFHSMLFDDGKFERPGSLRFEYLPPLGGVSGEPEVYEYDFTTLTQGIRNQFVESNWLGIPCEPNCVFFICNQFPIIGMRYYDLKHGTGYAEEATHNYSEAWKARGGKGWLDRDGMFASMYMQRQDVVVGDTYFTPWMYPYMNTWNGPMLRELYPSQRAGLLEELPDGTAYPRPFALFQKARRHSLTRGHDHGAAPAGTPGIEGDQRFGLVAMWLSEMGDPDLAKVLDYADTHLGPRWEGGGYFYPRNDQVLDDQGHYTYVEPFTGNALIAQARINVDDGYKQMYESPWGAEHFTLPTVVATEGNVELARAVYRPDDRALVLTAVSQDPGAPAEVRFTVANAPRQGNWQVYLGNEPRVGGQVGSPGTAGPTRVDWADGRMVVTVAVQEPTNVTVAWT